MQNTATIASNPSHLKKADVCKQLGISPRTLDNLVERREFPPGVRIGKWCYWTSKAIENFRERAFSAQENWSPMSSRRTVAHAR